MATGSPERTNSGSNNFDIASDDILCSYEDYTNQGSHSDPAIGTNASKDFSKSRLVPPTACAAPAHSQSEDSLFQDMIFIVEKSMKRNSDNILRFLEGISSRLSQLELYCYNLDKSVGKMRCESIRDHDDADEKLKSLEKQLQEVHRSVQILRDNQELAESQKELAKLHIVRRDSSSSSQRQSNEDKSPTSDTIRTQNISNASNQQLALALPHHQIGQLPQPVLLTSQAPSQSFSQPASHYLTSIQVQTMPAPKQMIQTQYVSSDPQYCASQLHIVSRIQAEPVQLQANQTRPPCPQQWSQSLTQLTPTEQQLPAQSQVKAPLTVYPSYPPSQPTNPAPREIQLSSAHSQEQYPGIPTPVSNHPDDIAIGYSGPGKIVQKLPARQTIKSMSVALNSDGYRTAEPHPSLSPGETYIVYDGDGRRVHHALQRPSFPQGSYPQPKSSFQNLQPNPPSNEMVQSPAHVQLVQSNPYNELIDRLVSMGFRVEHVLSVIRLMQESRQPVDFDSVLDRLRTIPPGNFQSGWSG